MTVGVCLQICGQSKNRGGFLGMVLIAGAVGQFYRITSIYINIEFEFFNTCSCYVQNDIIYFLNTFTICLNKHFVILYDECFFLKKKKKN